MESAIDSSPAIIPKRQPPSFVYSWYKIELDWTHSSHNTHHIVLLQMKAMFWKKICLSTSQFTYHPWYYTINMSLTVITAKLVVWLQEHEVWVSSKAVFVHPSPDHPACVSKARKSQNTQMLSSRCCKHHLNKIFILLIVWLPMYQRRATLKNTCKCIIEIYRTTANVTDSSQAKLSLTHKLPDTFYKTTASCITINWCYVNCLVGG